MTRQNLSLGMRWNLFWATLIVFLLTENITSSPDFLGHQFKDLPRAALLTSFWRHQFDYLQRAAFLTSLVQYDKVLSNWLWWNDYACSFNQWETVKYFEWIIIVHTYFRSLRLLNNHSPIVQNPVLLWQLDKHVHGSKWNQKSFNGNTEQNYQYVSLKIEN